MRLIIVTMEAGNVYFVTRGVVRMRKVIIALIAVVLIGCVVLVTKLSPQRDASNRAALAAVASMQSQQQVAPVATRTMSNPKPVQQPVQQPAVKPVESPKQSQPVAKPVEKAKPPVPSPDTWKVTVQDMGQTLVANTLQYQITAARVSMADGPIQPQNGNMFLLFDMNISNTGSGGVSLSPIMVFNLVDANQTTYSPDVLTSSEEALNVLLGPQRSVSGQVRFEVPKSVKQWTLQIDSSLVGASVSNIPVTISQ